MYVFCHEEKGKFHTAVFNVKSTGQFCFCLRHIKGRPVDFSEATDDVKNKGRRLIPDIPVPETTGLMIHYFSQP
jgi:hypothetical protein